MLNLLYKNKNTVIMAWRAVAGVLHCTVSDECLTHADTQRKLSWFNMLFACWFIQWENISNMSSFSRARMIHSGLFDLWTSPWFTVQISSAGQATRMLQRWHGQECNSVCPLRNRCFILIQCSNPHSVSYCRKSVNLSWLCSAEGKVGLLYLHEARIDSLRWISKTYFSS